MNLLSDREAAEAFQGWEDLLDTFCTVPLIYHRASTLPDEWGENRPQTTTHEMLAYYQQSVQQTNTIFMSPQGSYDDSNGYFLLSFLRLQEMGLVDAEGSLTLNPNTDYVEAFGKSYKILGIHPDGFLKTRFTLVFIVVKHLPRDV